METELVKYGAYGIAVMVIAILFWVIKFLFQKGTSIIEKLNLSIEANTKMTNETSIYLKQKNGSMEKCFTDVVRKLETVSEHLCKLDGEIRK